MSRLDELHLLLGTHFAAHNVQSVHALNEITLNVLPQQLQEVATILRDEPTLDFSMLIDITAVDYIHYGLAEWQTDEKTGAGYSRGVSKEEPLQKLSNTLSSRFAVVYHLMSVQHNWRLRLKVFLPDDELRVDSVLEIWPAANWFEREVFDLFGLIFEGHPDLRRLLTDYGFIGHPFRKDFPLSGHVEMRYDGVTGRVVYEPVQIEPRTLVPKVIRRENEYGRKRQTKSMGEAP